MKAGPQLWLHVRLKLSHTTILTPVNQINEIRISGDEIQILYFLSYPGCANIEPELGINELE